MLDESPTAKPKRKRRTRTHGSGSVYQRGRLFSIKWKERGAVRYKHGYDSREFAERVLATIVGNIAAGRAGFVDPDAPETGATTFNAMADKWLESRKHHRTVEDERLRLKKHLRPIFGSKRLRDITTEEIDQFLAGKLNAEKDEERLAAATVVQLRFILSRMYADAIRWDLATSSPVERAKRIRVTHDDEQFEYLTKSEIESLLTCDTVPFSARALYAVALLAGLRMGELYCLQWGDLDLERRQIAVRRSFKGPTKSGKPRFVPIHLQLAITLKQWRKAGRDPKPADLVFPNKRGELRSRYHDYGFKAHLTAARCKAIRFHDLRHSAASFYVSQGTPLRTVQQILGHASITTTERYSHLAPGYAQADVDKTRLDLGRGAVVSMTG